MPSLIKVQKSLSTAQWAELSEAMQRAGHTTPQAMEQAIRDYCQRWGVEFTATKRWGGKRRKDGRGE